MEITLPASPYEYDPWLSYLTDLDITAEISEKEFHEICLKFDTFLSAFPWLHAIWNKYGYFVWSVTDDFNKTQEVFERAFTPYSLYYSLDMWIVYLKFLTEKIGATNPQIVRLTYGRALDAVGSEYRSLSLWQSAIEFQKSINQPYFYLISRAVQSPVKGGNQYWNDTQKIFAQLGNPEFSQFSFINMSLEEFISTKLDEIIAGGCRVEGDISELRQNLIETITKGHQEANRKIGLFELYENYVTRHYFHFLSPDESQISNWQNYISAAEKQFYEGNLTLDEVKTLYHRALIPCAGIDALWFDFAYFLENAPLNLLKSSNPNSNFNENDQQYKEAIAEGYQAAKEVYDAMPVDFLPRTAIWVAEFEEAYSQNSEQVLAQYGKLSESMFVTHIEAAAAFAKRSGTKDPNAILQDGINRLKENGDQTGADLLLATLQTFDKDNLPPIPNLGQDAENPLDDSENLPQTAALYAAVAKRLSDDSNVDAVNQLLFGAIFRETDPLGLDQQIELTELYLEYIRRWGSPASFQMKIEIILDKMKSKLLWHKNFFTQLFLIENKNPDNFEREWNDYINQNLRLNLYE